MKDEWVISRVFQKTTTGSGGGSAVSATAGGSKKTKMSTSNSTTTVSFCPEPSSPSSVYLPPLLDSSPYTTTTTTTGSATSAAAYNGGHSYDNSTTNTTTREHVSCFSTISNNFANGVFDFAPMDSFARFQRNNSNNNNNVGVSAFPSLRSLQENLNLPFFFSPAAQPLHGGGSGDFPAAGSWPVPEDQRVADGGASMGLGPSELDCMWSY